MKKVIIFFVGMAFIASVASAAFGRTIEEEKLAVQNFLKVIDVKIVKARKAKQYSKVTMLKAQKSATLARWNKLKASMTVVPPPPPPPVAPVLPPPVVMQPAPAKPASLFGLGWQTMVSGSYLYTGQGNAKGAVFARGDLILDDMLGLAKIVGMNADALKWRIGTGFVYGTDDNNLKIQAIPLFADGVLMLPIGGMYVGGGVNYTLYGTGRVAGPYGVQAYIGLQNNMLIGQGMTSFELGYSVIRAGGDPSTRSAKGITLSIGQSIML